MNLMRFCVLSSDRTLCMVAWNVFPAVTSLWLGSRAKAFFLLSSSDLSGLVLRLVVHQLVIPAQILPDRSHSLIAQQFLQTSWVSSNLEIPERKAVAQDLGSDGGVTDPCSCTEPSKHHGHAVPGEWLLPLGSKQGISTSMPPGQSSLCGRAHLLQIPTQVAQTG
jgi:hypothetical protein